MSRMITRALRRATLSSSGMPSPRKREKERPRKVLGDVTNHSRRRKSKYTRILYKTVHKMVRFKETNQELKKTQTENDKRKGGKNNGHREEPKTPHRVIDIDSPHGKGSPQCPELAKSIVEHWLQQEVRKMMKSKRRGMREHISNISGHPNILMKIIVVEMSRILCVRC